MSPFVNVVRIFETGELWVHLSSFVEDDRDFVRFFLALPASWCFRLRPFAYEIHGAFDALEEHLTFLHEEEYEREQLDHFFDRQRDAHDAAVWGGDSD